MLVQLQKYLQWANSVANRPTQNHYFRVRLRGYYDRIPKAGRLMGSNPRLVVLGHLSEMRYKKGRPSSGPLRVESLEQLFNVDALKTEGGVQ
jgi:hypothetical protein